jgi:GDP-4-dehydro-6-deoxy-D-mannose reductase
MSRFASTRILSGLPNPHCQHTPIQHYRSGKNWTMHLPIFVRQLVRIKKGLQAPVVEVGNLKPRRAFLDVHDTVRGFYLAGMKGKRGEAYNLCASRTHHIHEVLETAIRLSGVKAEIRPVSRLMRPSDEKIILAAQRSSVRDTGWKPLNSLEQTLKSMLDYWRKVA